MQTHTIRVNAHLVVGSSAPALARLSAPSLAGGAVPASEPRLAEGWAPWLAQRQRRRARRARHIAGTITTPITAITESASPVLGG